MQPAAVAGTPDADAVDARALVPIAALDPDAPDPDALDPDALNPDVPDADLLDADALDAAPVTAGAQRRRGVAGRLVQAGLWAAVAFSLVLFRDELPDLGAIWRSVQGADPAWLAVAVVAEAVSMGAFARLQRRLLAAGGTSVSLRRAFAVTYASNALSTTLPAGPAVSVVYSFRQWRRSGSSAQLATAVILVGGVVTSTAYTIIGLLALLTEPDLRGPAITSLAAMTGCAAVLVLLFVLGRRAPHGAGRRAVWRAVWRAKAASAVRRAADRRPQLPILAEQLRQGWQILRLGRAGWTVVATLAALNWVSDIVALIAAGMAVGVKVPPYDVTLAYFAAQAAGSVLPLLPGGLGAIESSMVASLAAFGAAAAPAAAAVGLYRLVSFWAVIAAGWMAYLGLRGTPVAVASAGRLLGTWALRGVQVIGSAVVPTYYPVPCACHAACPTVLRQRPMDAGPPH